MTTIARTALPVTPRLSRPQAAAAPKAALVAPEAAPAAQASLTLGDNFRRAWAIVKNTVAGDPTLPFGERLRRMGTMATWGVEGALTEARDWVDYKLHGPTKGPFPSMKDLQKKFPDAGLPDRIMGTTIDKDALKQPGATPDSVMAKAAAMGMNTVRLGVYWNEVQPNGPTDANFKQLDALLAAAQRHGIKVILSVGTKAPSYPEFYAPEWAGKGSEYGGDASQDPAFQARQLAFVKLSAQHLAGNPAVCMWQVENEPFTPAGPQMQHLDEQTVAAEAATLRQADGGRRPVMVNLWTLGTRSSALEPAFRVGDVVGLDVYNAVPAQPGRWDRVVGQPNEALKLAQKTGKPVMIAELQADDWGVYKTNATDITSLTRRMQTAGIQDILFWRLSMNMAREAQGDPSLTQAETRLTQEAIAPQK